ncbi:MAG: DUF3553 domain-containing protein, partial [Candidatus Omnitrophica bacterium]|nr:DUF3553 domain-containing protein [Candidatus Omnitrophota bacterium]
EEEDRFSGSTATRNPRQSPFAGGRRSYPKAQSSKTPKGTKGGSSKSASPASIPDFLKPGKVVRHRTFGLGEVMNAEGSEPALKITVNFTIAGKKTVVQKFAKLEPA